MIVFVSLILFESEVAQLRPTLCDPMDCSPRNFPGRSAAVGCHFLLQRIFLSQGSNSGLPHCWQRLYLWVARGEKYLDFWYLNDYWYSWINIYYVFTIFYLFLLFLFLSCLPLFFCLLYLFFSIPFLRAFYLIPFFLLAYHNFFQYF